MYNQIFNHELLQIISNSQPIIEYCTKNVLQNEIEMMQEIMNF